MSHNPLANYDPWITSATNCTGTVIYAYEGAWSTEPIRNPSATPAIEDRPGFRQRPGARPAHKSVSERISRKPRALE